jgi:hypothetical protein
MAASALPSTAYKGSLLVFHKKFGRNREAAVTEYLSNVPEKDLAYFEDLFSLVDSTNRYVRHCAWLLHLPLEFLIQP